MSSSNYKIRVSKVLTDSRGKVTHLKKDFVLMIQLENTRMARSKFKLWT